MMDKKMIFTKSVFLIYFALFIASCSQNAEKPNFIIFLVDDLGWKDVGYMGSKYYETPNIDQMAREGMSFTSAYANAPNCAPTRACLMSGMYTPRHGVYTVGDPARGKSENRMLIPSPNNTELDGSFVTLAEALKENGYANCHVGKWHLGEDDLTSPEAQG
ncbi:MAG: sulfatase-like hydrolase/transferase, partial [Cyclobacteriaceae bacterium]|nr:sulfatase-like hydrolase/transferase [Cyclobacteriaceae bacterium]